MAFTLHPQLEADTHFIADLPLSHLLLMNDARFPWLILVPRVANASEWFDLDSTQQAQLSAEACRVGATLKAQLNADKINIAALGNQVPQLHVHVIARFKTDPAWPQSVWNCITPRVFYMTEQANFLVKTFSHLMTH